MTRERSRNSSLSFVTALIVILVVAFAARAQVKGVPESGENESLFLPVVTSSVWGTSPQTAQIADLNGDGVPDVVAGGSGYIGNFMVLLGNGDGSFSPNGSYETGGQGATQPVVADLNLDGKPDVVVGESCAGLSNCASGETLAGVLLSNGDGTFQPAVVYKAGGSQFVSSIVVTDLNRDGMPDLVLTSWRCTSSGFEGCVSVLMGNGDGTFRTPMVYDSGGWNGEAVVVTDVNKDGKLDLVVGNLGGNPTSLVGVLLGNGDGTFQAAVSYSSGGGYGGAPVVADVNGDGRPDLLVPNQCVLQAQGCVIGGVIGVLLGKGDGTFWPVVTVSSGGNGIVSVVPADVNRDGALDLLVANCGSLYCQGLVGLGGAGVSVLLGKGDGTFLPAAIYDYDPLYSPRSIAISDLNSDGKADIVTIKFHSVSVDVMLGNGDGTFRSALTYDLGGVAPMSLVVTDVNADGRSDLVLTGSYGVDHAGVAVLLNNSRSVQISTSTTLVSSRKLTVYGQAVVFTAQVTAASGTPTGTVILFNGAIAVGSGTLVNGKASISIGYLPAGSNSITAAYQASASFVASRSAPLTQVVTIATTAAGLTSSLNPTATNQPVTYTATITSQYGGLATGSVVFALGSQTLGTGSLVGNRATFTTSFATPGTYSISAHYMSDVSNAGSTSAILSQKIIASTTTILTSSQNPALMGQAITFTATVFATTGFPPNGEIVTFKKASALLGSAPLSGGTASFTISSLPVGVSAIAAGYGGDSKFAASTSSGLQQVVKATSKSATSTMLASSLNPSIYGQAVTWAAMVTTSGSVPPTGNVAFRWSNSGRIFTIGTAPLNTAGVATLTRSNLPADPFGAPYALVAVYSGDTWNLSSTSAVVAQEVLQAKTAATITSSLNPSTQGQAVTFTAKITSPTVMVSGPVTFSVGTTVLGTTQLWGGGNAKFTTSTLPAGSSRVKVTYYGNSNISESSAALTQTVQ
jgi:hypothetical protein